MKYQLAQAKAGILRQKGKAVYEQKAVFKGNQHSGPLSIIDNEPKHDTRKEIAQELGWSTGKVGMADVVNKKAPEEVKQQVVTGELTINEAYQNIKAEETKQQQEAIRNSKVVDSAFLSVTEPFGEFSKKLSFSRL